MAKLGPLLPLVLVALAAGPAAAQVAQPADAARSGAEQAQPPTDAQQRRMAEGHVVREPSYEAPPVEGGFSPVGISEEDRVGEYGQPRWTAHRRFAETRVYVRPAGFFELEWWIEPEIEHGGGGKVDTTTRFEAELGLGHRLQLDFYLIAEKVGHEGDVNVAGESIELRYGLADWGVIPGNPALYVEYQASSAKTSEPDTIETKLLLGGEIAPRWHWGANLSFERQLSGELQNEYMVTGGISYAVTDTSFKSEGVSVGAEVKAPFTDVTGRRGNMHEECLIGPSVQWRPYPAAHIDIVPLFGVTGFSPQFAPVIVMAWEF
jgi:hypothetical protein